MKDKVGVSVILVLLVLASITVWIDFFRMEDIINLILFGLFQLVFWSLVVKFLNRFK